MAKSSRWTQWIIAESAKPGVPMPWAVGGRIRHTRVRRTAMTPA